MDGCHKNWVNSDDTAMKDLLTGGLCLLYKDDSFLLHDRDNSDEVRQFFIEKMELFVSFLLNPSITLTTINTKEGKIRA